MRDLVENGWRIIVLSMALSLCLSLSAISYTHLSNLVAGKKVHEKSAVSKDFRSRIIPSRGVDRSAIVHKRVKRWLHGKPAIVNILVMDPKKSGCIIKPSYGSYFIDNLKGVMDIVNRETAFAGINASYFKPD